MAPRTNPPNTPHSPQVGEVVADLGHEGRQGVYMGRLRGRAYLRPLGGGIEWDTDPRNLEQLSDPAQLVQVSTRSRPRSPERVRLPGPAPA
ncbi:hypothetical protein C7C46_00990 [Streptomyces tateyamensis]|uniref:Uncharacterized protein n=1 Tax=Streptomyces tateyamensis TaxID=565073 RepID=A0A2V4NPB3_9ACTN|nr:hypothetical protein C7C46_00990 [Streptomyces tateyamensis]